MIITLGREAEEQLHGHGFEIPMYPETGPVMFGPNQVGRIDNFNGLTIRDEFEDEVKLILSLKDEINMGLWNIPDYH